ncbi:unnamed protein product [Choristocarpus tenellus]
MPSSAFVPFFEIFAEGVVLTVAAITTVSFAGRCLRSTGPLNITGLLASVISTFYSTFALAYWFGGGEGFNCTRLAAINGTCMSASNGLTFLHLFIKADASNKLNHGWKYWKWVGVVMTIFNWVTLVTVHSLHTGVMVDGLDGPRCKFTFEEVSFKLKWIAQFCNQVFQVWLTCPL